MSGSSRSGAPLRYRSRYGFVGPTAANHSDMVLGGLNEKGLNVGMFDIPSYAQYTPAAKARCGQIMVLLQFTAQALDLIGIVPDMHSKVQDTAATSIVIEARGGRPVVHDNPTRVLNNAPTFDWHLTNLNNDVRLIQAYPTPKAAAPVSVQRPWLRS